MKKILLIGAVLFVSMHGIAGAQVKDIKLCTPVWESYSQRDGKGLYHDLFKEIFVSNGIKVVNTYAPFKRCEKLVAVDKKKIWTDTVEDGKQKVL